MSPTRLLFEGPDVATVLARVRAEHGTGARIVAADKVRSGGFAGFFTKERYEVTVEVETGLAAPDDALADGSAPGASGAASGEPAPPGPHPAEQRTMAASTARSGASPSEDMPPLFVLDLLDSVNSAERQEFSLYRDQVSAAPHLPLLPEDSPGSPANPEFQSVLDGLARDLEEASHAPAPTEISPVAEITAAAEISSGAEIHSVAEAPGARAARARRPRGLPSRRAFSSVGLDPRLVPGMESGTDLRSALTGSLAGVAATPRLPLGPGEVIALIGTGTGLLPAARQAALALGLRPAGVALVAAEGSGQVEQGPHRLRTVGEAARRAARLARRQQATVVAVDCGDDGSSTTWAAAVLEALDVSAVCLLVDAGDKVADVRRRVAEWPRADALVVEGTGRTADPATVLSLGVPVATLDDAPSSPAAWADLIARRLGGRP